MGKFIDLTGKRFGRLTVLERAPNHGKRTMWLCCCDCNTQKVVSSDELKSGKTQSCGCLHREISSKVLRRMRNEQNADGRSKTRLYKIWKGMKERCYRKTNADYNRYGGRGIQVCSEWRRDFFAFKSWALSCGYSDGLTIDRINNDGDYCPENCRWATISEQSNNRRSNVLLSAYGVTHTMAEWARVVGISTELIWYRLNHGWPVEQAINIPAKKYRNQTYTCGKEAHTITEWSKITGLTAQCIRSRLNRGWSIERALTTAAETKYMGKKK